MKKRTVTLTCFLLIIPILCVFLLMGWNSAYTVIGDHFRRGALVFDSEQWKTSTALNLTRYSMIRDLIKKHKIVGMSKDDMLRLLGLPDDDKDKEWNFIYLLGPANYLDRYLLLIKLNDEDKVVKYSICIS